MLISASAVRTACSVSGVSAVLCGLRIGGLRQNPGYRRRGRGRCVGKGAVACDTPDERIDVMRLGLRFLGARVS